MFDNKTILVTGGTGSFGKKFLKMTFEKYNPKKIIIYSRDELKQFELMEKKGLRDKPVRFFLGDVRDKERLKMAMNGVDYVVHAAAYKHVPAAEYNPFEFVKTNINGAQNVIEAAHECGVEKVVALSTDKACNPINLYGATKLASDKIFVAANAYTGQTSTSFSIVRYGNVVGSRGSVIPFFLNCAKKGMIPITDPEMTRFWITLDDAVKMVWYAMENSHGGEIYVPKIPTMSILDLAEVVAPGVETNIIGIRPGEKLHEAMISEDDSRYTFDFGSYYAILPAIHNWHEDTTKNQHRERVEKNFSYTSGRNPEKLSREKLTSLLEQYHHSGPELIDRGDLAFYS